MFLNFVLKLEINILCPYDKCKLSNPQDLSYIPNT